MNRYQYASLPNYVFATRYTPETSDRVREYFEFRGFRVEADNHGVAISDNGELKLIVGSGDWILWDGENLRGVPHERIENVIRLETKDI